MERIIICDDDVQICRFLKLAFQRHPFDVELTHTASACFEACRINSPQLLITDLHLPDMEGSEMIRQLRQILPTLPIIAISGATDDVLQTAWLNGANWVMRKPIIPGTLLETARHLLDSRTPTP